MRGFTPIWAYERGLTALPAQNFGLAALVLGPLRTLSYRLGALAFRCSVIKPYRLGVVEVVGVSLFCANGKVEVSSEECKHHSGSSNWVKITRCHPFMGCPTGPLSP